MSTEAMLNRFRSWWKSSKYCQVVVPKYGWEQIALDGFNQGVQAATANQEALIKAALDAAAEVCDDKELITLHPFANVARIKRAIRQITPQQVMEKMK